jgi:hypothetical protein
LGYVNGFPAHLFFDLKKRLVVVAKVLTRIGLFSTNGGML